jgi:hypothetical protein
MPRISSAWIPPLTMRTSNNADLLATAIFKGLWPIRMTLIGLIKNRYMKDRIIVLVALLCCFAQYAQSQTANEAWIRVTDSITGAQGYKNKAGKLVIPQGKYSHCFTDTFRNYAAVLDPGKGYVAIDRQEKAMYSVFIFDNGPLNKLTRPRSNCRRESRNRPKGRSISRGIALFEQHKGPGNHRWRAW